MFIRREDAQQFIEEVRGDDPELAAKLRIEERELEAGGPLVLTEAPPAQLVDLTLFEQADRVTVESLAGIIASR